MQKKQRFKRLQHTLMLAFLALSITPLTLLAIFFLESHSSDLETQSTTHLAFLRDNKQEQINSYFDAKYSEVKSFSRSELATVTGGRFYGLVASFHLLGDTREEASQIARQNYGKDASGNPNADPNRVSDSNYVGSERYRLLHKRYDWAFKEHLKRSDFTDILLVDIDGNVVYSALKENNFGANLMEPQWKTTAVGKTFADIQRLTNASSSDTDSTPVAFTDFTQSSDGKLYAWFAAPVKQQGYLHSYVLFKLPNTALANMLNDTPREKGFISSLLVGEDLLPRNAQDKQPISPIDNSAVEAALSGLTEVGSFLGSDGMRVLGAYSPISVFDNQWALILELPEEEAFARIYQLEKIFIVVMVVAIVLVVFASHLLSNSITAPLLRLTWAAEQVSAGDLDQKISSTDREDEIGRLAISFARMQRSVREKLALIREQNKELELNIQTIKQKNEELQQADRMKDDFLATTSHELRTPLHGMIGIAESILAGVEGPLPERQKLQLQMLINSGERLSTLVDDLLDYHKMRYGDLEISPQAVDTATAARLVIELSSHLLGGKPVRIINQLPIDLPLVRADEQRLEQVLYNLIGNAIKYTDEGKIIISATVLDDQIRIQVVDTGQGIPSDQLEYIFEPLTQASSGSNAYRQGAGLGLSISRQLIDIMGGQLYVSSQPMVGTTFSFTLPIATEEDKAKTRLAKNVHFAVPKIDVEPLEIEQLPENPDGPLILVVDDEPVNLQVLNNFLKLEGYRVKTVENGRQAIESVTMEQPDLMLLDVMMPELSGYEVCAHLRERYSRSELPIIMLSALGQVQDKVKGFDAGANDYLTKPFNKDELSARIRAYIDASLTEQEREKNRQLNEEIGERDQVEAGLREVQSRLFEMLDSASEAILCVQGNGKISYANDACHSIFHLSAEQLERHLLEDFLAMALPEANRGHYSGQIKFKIDGEIVDVSSDVITLPESSGLQMMFIMSTGGKASSHRVEQLEKAVEALSDYAFDGTLENLQQLRELGGEFTRMADKFSGGQPDKTDVIRDTLVKVMLGTLSYWNASTGKSKFDLAEESGLWRVYLDRSTLQTRTLDKYLHTETVPKSPRWRTVLNTIDFVLERCGEHNQERAEVEFLRDKLQG
ncbi:response regulator [Enterovibrio coralii]|uniref:histidine kinase n=1 Tax=Enterovibrio coralii TaxID=294935 RepID=A0A135I2F1_9GAMM|nr:response regulator [Enterovibrio coralii]KXF79617.1 hybrid sensor histidine kinase/response regulator [Enterovibrio coralii]